VYVTVNVSQLKDMAKGSDTINLTELGIDKLLGSGRISTALKVIVEEASANAVVKVEAAGGSIESGDDDWEEE
jgi:large subunit ribosomal protein L15